MIDDIETSLRETLEKLDGHFRNNPVLSCSALAALAERSAQQAMALLAERDRLRAVLSHRCPDPECMRAMCEEAYRLRAVLEGKP
jgi:translation elongation factor EF-Tu-like GTPase